MNETASQWMALLKAHGRMDGATLRVMQALAEHADDEGYSQPGHGALSRDLGISVRNVRKSIGCARTAGWVTKAAPADPSNLIPVTYRLALPERWQE